MMLSFKRCLLLSFFINYIQLFSSGYLYGKLDENFENGMQFYIDLDFRDVSHGILLYAIDRNRNRFLIESAEKYRGRRKIVFNFNGQIFNSTNTYWRFSGTSTFTIFLQFKYDNLYIMDYSYRHATLLNVFNRNKTNPDTFVGYPISDDHNSTTRTTDFWLGNVGPSIGKDKTVFQPSKVQMVGCVYNFRINYKEIKFTTYGDDLLPFCRKQFSETICIKGKCKKEQRRSYILDCSLSEMNTKEYCYEDFLTYMGQTLSYLTVGLGEEPRIMKMVWKQEFSKDYCLLEIETKKESSILVYANRLNEIVLNIRSNRSVEWTRRTLCKMQPNLIHVLLIEFVYPNFVLKISNGSNVLTFIEHYPDYIIKIDVAYKSHRNLCSTFEGQLAFQYEPGLFLQLNKQETTAVNVFHIIHSWRSVLCLITILSLGLVILVIGICICHLKKVENSRKKLTIVTKRQLHFLKVLYVKLFHENI